MAQEVKKYIYFSETKSNDPLLIDYIPNVFKFTKNFFFFFFKLGFTPCKAEQPLQGMELQEKETQKD